MKKPSHAHSINPLWLMLLLLLQLWVISASAMVDYSQLRFQSLTTQQGLSRALVKSMAMDEFGMLWIATENGLNRFDGYRFEVFRNQPDKPNSLPDNNVLSVCYVAQHGLFAGLKSGVVVRYNQVSDLFEVIDFDNEDIKQAFQSAEPDFLIGDSNSNLWIATTNGLFFYNLSSGFSRHFNTTNSGLLSNYIKHIYIDSQNQMWLATDAGLAKVVNHQSADVQIITLNSDDLPSNYVKQLTEDLNGNIWVGSDGGLTMVDRENGKALAIYSSNSPDGNGLTNNYIKAVATDANGKIWVGHDLGVSIFDPQKESFVNYQAGIDDNESLINNYVKFLLPDQHQIMWIGTDLGISYFDPVREQFHSLSHQSSHSDQLSGSLVYDLFESATDSIWLATNNGLNLWNPLTAEVQYFFHEPNNKQSLPGNIIRSVITDKTGILWVGTDNGLCWMNLRNADEGFRTINMDSPEGRNLNNNFVVTIKALSDGKIWVGTWGGGVNILDPQSGTIEYLTAENTDSTKRIFNNQIANIFQDSKENVWLRSGNLFNVKTRTTSSFPFSDVVNNINFFFEDSKGRIWIGTSSQGLGFFQYGEQNIHWITAHNLLHEGVVASMLEDHNGFLWIAVNKMIARLSPDLQELNVFDKDDGLQDGDYSNEAAFNSPSGNMYFGGSRGLSYFNPDKVQTNQKAVRVYLTGMQLYNQTLQPQPETVLDSSLIVKKHLILPHNHRELVFEFTGINYTNPNKNKYAYTIQNLQTEWIYTDADNRIANYFQIPPGNYTLLVKAANSSGVWDATPAQLKITVLPPWYKLWWVRALTVLLLLFLVYLFIHMRTKRLNSRNVLLEQKVRERTNQLAIQKEEIEKKNLQLAEASKAKSEFLANMSHEIRTPLNGVIGFTDLVLKTELSSSQEEYLQIVSQSAENLLNIINDILDFSKIEAGKLELYIEKVSLHDLGNQAVDIITYQAQQKGLEILLDMPPQLPGFIWTDLVRLKQVLVNLLSNATKFTEKGEIELKTAMLHQVDENNAVFRFSVRDTGIGIKPERMQLIFEAFTQEDSSTTKRFGGTGLGLTISNKLLGLMESKLQLESKPGVGSNFFFDLLLQFDGEKDVQAIPQSINIKKVLIVDDNQNNRRILKKMLQHLHVEAIESDGAVSAIEALRNIRDFDLIFMDYHMPDVDGLQLAERITKEPDLLHPSTQIIMWHSSVDSREFIDRCEQMGIKKRMIKPIKLENLLRVLQRIKTDETAETEALPTGSRSYEDIFHILLVEDNQVNMMLAKSILRKIVPDSILHEAVHGGEAVTFCGNQRPDFILMDVQMPVMNGYETTIEIRKMPGFEDVPIVALTAGNVKGEKEKCIEAGMSDFLTKPVVEETITLAIEKWLQPVKIKKSNNKTPKAETPKEDEFSFEMLKDDLGDDPVFLREFLNILKESLLTSKAQLRQHIENKDFDLLFAEAHKLKGTAYSVNLVNLSNLAHSLEKYHELDSNDVNQLLHQIDENIAQLLPQIEAELKKFSDMNG